MTWLLHQSHKEVFDETATEQKCIPLDDIMCVHQRLDPNKRDNFKRLNEVRIFQVLNRQRAIFEVDILECLFKDCCGHRLRIPTNVHSK